jgi:tRNA(adenine34) deaminase
MMARALALARRGLVEGELPIGALLAVDEVVVAEAYWSGDPDRGLLRHPELVVLTEADRLVGRRRREATLYTTLEPCLMCMGAATTFFLGRLVYALGSPTDGATRVTVEWAPPAGHPREGPRPYGLPDVAGGICTDEARGLVREYLASGISGPQAEFAATLVEPRG